MKTDNPLLGSELICSVCGKQQVCHYNRTCNEELHKHQLCFSCNHWRGHYEQNLNESIRVKGVHYMACPETGPSAWRGFGGSKFKVKMNDGRVFETTNLWCQGHITPQWKDKLPDNAEFIYDNQPKEEGMRDE